MRQSSAAEGLASGCSGWGGRGAGRGGLRQQHEQQRHGGRTAQNVLAVQYSEIPTVQSVRTSPQVLAENPVLATVPKTRLVPRPAGHPQLPAAEHRDLPERQLSARRLHLAHLGHGIRPISRPDRPVQLSRRPVSLAR